MSSSRQTLGVNTVDLTKDLLKSDTNQPKFEPVSSYIPVDVARDFIKRYKEGRIQKWNNDPIEASKHWFNQNVKKISNALINKPITIFKEIPSERKKTCEALDTAFFNLKDSESVCNFIMRLYKEAQNGINDATLNDSLYCETMFAAINSIVEGFKASQAEDYQNKIKELRNQLAALEKNINEKWKSNQNIQELVMGGNNITGYEDTLNLLVLLGEEHLLAFRFGLFSELPLSHGDSKRSNGIIWRDTIPLYLTANYHKKYYETRVRSGVGNISFKHYCSNPDYYLTNVELKANMSNVSSESENESKTDNDKMIKKPNTISSAGLFTLPLNPTDEQKLEPSPSSDDYDSTQGSFTI